MRRRIYIAPKVQAPKKLTSLALSPLRRVLSDYITKHRASLLKLRDSLQEDRKEDDFYGENIRAKAQG